MSQRIPEIINGREVKITRPLIHKTPRLILTDAYTFGSFNFEAFKAKKKSGYYITFRKHLNQINPYLYPAGEDRYIFMGLPKIIWYLFSERITMEEILETDEFCAEAKVTMDAGKPFQKYEYPREMWVKIVEKYNGRPPIEIKALPEGSVCYPNEPIVEISSSSLTDEEMGFIAAWFEPILLMTWSATEYTTQNEHWLMTYKRKIAKIDPLLSPKEVDFHARIHIIDFGARSSICPQEMEWLGEYYIHTFPGTDTFAGAYQAWNNNNRLNNGLFNTINAMAHRNVQSFDYEGDSYRSLYDSMGNNHLGSFVDDCYSSYDAVEKYLLPLALDARDSNNGKVIIARQDSGNIVEQTTWIARLAHKHGLYTTKIINGREWRMATNLKIMDSSDVKWQTIGEDVWNALAEQSFMPYSWMVYGMGGYKRNSISRDNSSAKYALHSVGSNNRGVCKFSEELQKTTLPGPFKLLRDQESLNRKMTIVHDDEPGEDIRVVHYNGADIYEPFKPIMNRTVNERKAKTAIDLQYYPGTLTDDNNGGFPISDKVRDTRRELLAKYAPKKQKYVY